MYSRNFALQDLINITQSERNTLNQEHTSVLK